MTKKRLLVMAGGTGGHVFPGLAVAKFLEKQGWDICWLGTADRMEAELVPKYGIEIAFIRVKGLIGSGLMRKLRAPWMIVSAIWQARQVIKRVKPDAVLGMGGYVSGPGGIAAWLSGVPVILHEQNAVAGLTNQWLAKVAKQVLQAFPGAFDGQPVVGNPVRRDVCDLPDPAQRFADRQGALRILVMGGSQGARILNQTVPEAMPRLEQSVTVRHQAGKNNAEKTLSAYQHAGMVDVDVSEFIDDVAEAYAWADVVICRSGALTVSELAAAGVGAIFVPFMHADRQQALNGDYLVSRGAALMIEQPSLTAQSLAETINRLDRHRLLAMATAARDAAIIDADARVADAITAHANT
ncbi:MULTISPECIES: undecaprenyldiphospho-muramoylpentapeptide beta-N-acetylglucosaminyltransferase [unclassified Salinivibrio]|uniref:undecaprenyldiphospho-muramoylpentapeptide beta-N-acetylglucosaminyltransferase n=1 Tax=unclassified Salinivibrio TaxID=2636825 RepID=UPI0009865C58|nr:MULTISPECIES: undecaprenyldiphospho-muramoylpentapeptide beta-N-acetylglucosaminyltransferase [unclassified Salinivibrio]OOE95063.1 undecaprenyldiphospho-muramoylpentapeptide beta-N-acetylglucosaminyltransferase [Salinivibrio sp. AR640]OOF06967.1 undecaprenyldiphospho-muramoylpentapeptide beta-N-acetylglucosaminyltransferase [Salinivibrio sp. MA607]